MAKLDQSWSHVYEKWKRQSHEKLVAKQWQEAFATYPWPTYDTTPFCLPDKPLSEMKVALVSSAGITSQGMESFDQDVMHGDQTWRVLSANQPLSGVTIRHGHYNPAAAEADYNVVFPLDTLRLLARDGVIGSASERAISFVGFQTDAVFVAGKLASDIIAELRRDSVDAVLLVPV